MSCRKPILQKAGLLAGGSNGDDCLPGKFPVVFNHPLATLQSRGRPDFKRPVWVRLFLFPIIPESRKAIMGTICTHHLADNCHLGQCQSHIYLAITDELAKHIKELYTTTIAAVYNIKAVQFSRPVVESNKRIYETDRQSLACMQHVSAHQIGSAHVYRYSAKVLN